jgi:hypothetical protein
MVTPETVYRLEFAFSLTVMMMPGRGVSAHPVDFALNVIIES